MQVDELQYEGPPDKRDEIVSGLRDTLLTGLDRSSGFQIVTRDDQTKALVEIAERDRAGEVIPNKDAALAAILKADYVCRGKVVYVRSGSSESVTVHLEILKMPGDKPFKQVVYEGDPVDRFSMQDAFFKRVYNALTDSPDETEVAISNLAGTSKYSAYRLYSLALRKWETDPQGALVLADAALSEDPLFASPWRLKGVIRYRKLGQGEAALSDFEKSLVLRPAADSDSAFVLEMIGLIHLDSRNFPQALRRLDEALKIKSAKGGADAARLEIHAGLAWSGMGHPEKALERYHRARQMLEQTGWHESHYAAALANNEGTALYAARREREALAAFEEARAIRLKLQLRNTIGYALATANAGLVLSAADDMASLAKARVYIEESQEIRRRLGLERTIDYARSQVAYASACRKSGALSQAIAALEPVAARLSDSGLSNTEAREYVFLLEDLGTDYLSAKQFALSEEAFLRAVALLKSHGGADSANHARIMERIIRTKLQSGKQCEALPDMRKLYTMYQDKLQNAENANRLGEEILGLGTQCK